MDQEIVFTVLLHGNVEGKLSLTSKRIAFSPTTNEEHDDASPSASASMSEHGFSHHWKTIEKQQVSKKPGGTKVKLFLRPKEVEGGEIRTRDPIVLSTLDHESLLLLYREIANHLRATSSKKESVIPVVSKDKKKKMEEAPSFTTLATYKTHDFSVTTVQWLGESGMVEDEGVFTVRLGHDMLEGKLILTPRGISSSPSTTNKKKHDGISPTASDVFSYQWKEIEKEQVSSKPNGTKMRLLFCPTPGLTGEVRTRDPIVLSTLDHKSLLLLHKEVTKHLKASKKESAMVTKCKKTKTEHKSDKARSSTTLVATDEEAETSSHVPIRVHATVQSPAPSQAEKKNKQKKAKDSSSSAPEATTISMNHKQKTKGQKEQGGVEHARECTESTHMHDLFSDMEEGHATTNSARREQPTLAGDEEGLDTGNKGAELMKIVVYLANIFYVGLVIVAICIIIGDPDEPYIYLLPCVLAMAFSALAVYGAYHLERRALGVALFFFLAGLIGCIIYYYTSFIGISLHAVMCVTHAVLLCQLGCGRKTAEDLVVEDH